MSTAQQLAFSISTERRAIHVLLWDDKNDLVRALLALLAFCNATNIDMSRAFENKLRLTCEKYPAEKVKGSYDKYTRYKNNDR